jgi:hypothetical protein
MPHLSVTEMATEDPSDAQASHSSSLHVLHRDSNLRLVFDISLRSGIGKAAKIEQRGRALQTHQQRTHADALPRGNKSKGCAHSSTTIDDFCNLATWAHT